MLKKKTRKYSRIFIKSERNACQNRFLITLITANLTRCYQNYFVKSRRIKFLRFSQLYFFLIKFVSNSLNVYTCALRLVNNYIFKQCLRKCAITCQMRAFKVNDESRKKRNNINQSWWFRQRLKMRAAIICKFCYDKWMR